MRNPKVWPGSDGLRMIWPGKTVTICGPHHYSGYRGVTQFTHVHLDQYAVRLEANGRIMMIDGTFLL